MLFIRTYFINLVLMQYSDYFIIPSSLQDPVRFDTTANQTQY